MNSQSLKQHASYHRREIDGLRALAVTAVIGFHFFPNALPSGYLGVDLFFVISGYLITLLIKKQAANREFCFSSFYLKRAKRILPAMLAMLIASSIAATWILLAPDLQRYAKSLLATLSYIANIYFWRTGGYFSTSDELKPLLHMWSLGVEEQFYLLFPAILIIIFRFIRPNLLKILALLLIAICSYGLNIYLANIGGSNPAFFLLPTRIWQFSIGSFFAVLPTIQTANSSRLNLTFVTGLALIAINFMDPESKIPSATLLTLGTGFILWNKLNSNSPLLRYLITKPVELVGLCSFSLYLWHWPILVFLKYIYVDSVPLHILLGALLATILISYLSWRYIENPFRNEISTKVKLYAILITYILLAAYAAMMLALKGLPNRDTDLANSIANAIDSNYRCPPTSYRLYGASRSCLIGDSKKTPSLALLGNSHAQMYAPAVIESLTANHQAGLIIPLNDCLPTIDLNISTECLKMAQINYQAIEKDRDIKTVILGMTWYSNDLVDESGNKIYDPSFIHREKSIMMLLDNLSKSGKYTYLVGPIAIPNFDFASVASRNIKFGNVTENSSIPRASFDEQFKTTISSFSKKLKNRFIAPHEALCDLDHCNFADENGSYFSDSNHLSVYGTKKVQKLFNPIFER
ncbi:acyltransferase [Polynucleobacter sp. AP-Jannik-300A-C4]|uniref:acyltransferase family protein n=1 Tax=Polynucleobacter sp. AP-Jannik-300A-C4 TaxID=2576928 RepID=UPI001BFE78FD|nr:acyltransferase family protein [Polynucleobacter sp. AP-Jannik-300A-C4]QWE22923.1 acyltransferase [Polynucleobacter sp. AP-Jannik-300A-C4]